MPNIVRVAYFEACPNCGKHAHIVQGDGTLGIEFLTKKEGHEQVRDLFLQKLIQRDEASFLKEEIEKSSLPEEESPEVAFIREIVQEELMEHYPEEDFPGRGPTIH